MRIRLHRNYWGPQFPTTITGERFIVFANKIDPKQQNHYILTEVILTVPLWLRQQQADYRVSVFGMNRISGDQKTGYAQAFESLDDFESSIKEFLVASPEEQQLTIIKYNVLAYMLTNPPDFQKLSESELYDQTYNQNELFHLRPRIQKAQSTNEILDEIIAMDFNDEYQYERLLYPFQSSYSSRLRDLNPKLKQASARSSKLVKKCIDDVISRIEKDKAQAEKQTLTPPELRQPKKLRSTHAAMEGYRKAFNGDEDASQEYEASHDAFKMLSQFDPDVVSDRICKYELDKDPNTKSDNSTLNKDRAAGYRQASAFAYYCGSNRKQQFQKLYTQGKAPYVRTTGAVYLSFEDEKAGLRALRECAEFEGDPGAWAALNLLRRGEKNAMPRALVLYKNPFDNSSMDGMPHRNLRFRLAILIASSCTASNTPCPGASNGMVGNSIPIKKNSYNGGTTTQILSRSTIRGLMNWLRKKWIRSFLFICMLLYPCVIFGYSLNYFWRNS